MKDYFSVFELGTSLPLGGDALPSFLHHQDLTQPWQSNDLKESLVLVP